MHTADSNSPVALFLPSLRGGGAERMILNLATALASRGWVVHLVLAKAEGPYLAQVPHNVRVVDLETRRTSASCPRLVRYLRKTRPRVLLSAMKHANVTALMASAFAGERTPVVISERNFASASLASVPGARTWGLRMLMRLLYPRARHIVAISKGVAIDLAGLLRVPPESVRVVYNPVVDAGISKRAEESLDHPWFQPCEPPVVLAVGRLEPQKDFTTLLRAFCEVRRERPARLMILGEGSERGSLERLVDSLGLGADVQLPGFVPNPLRYMSRCGVFVLSSRWEGFGNVLVEAMACGTPVVSTDCPSGPAEILENGRWGRMVPVGEASALADAIRETLEDPGPDPRRRALHFTVDSAATQYAALLEEV